MKKIILILIIILVSYIMIISYRINDFLSSESNISEEVFLKLSEKGLTKEEINKLPDNLVKYIAKDENLKELTKLYMHKNGTLFFKHDYSKDKQENKIALSYFIRDNIKFNPFNKDKILILMTTEESFDSDNFLYVEGIDYLGRTRTYNKIPMTYFSDQKNKSGEVFVVPNLIVYKRFIICNPPYKTIYGYLSK